MIKASTNDYYFTATAEHDVKEVHDQGFDQAIVLSLPLPSIT